MNLLQSEWVSESFQFFQSVPTKCMYSSTLWPQANRSDDKLNGLSRVYKQAPYQLSTQHIWSCKQGQWGLPSWPHDQEILQHCCIGDSHLPTKASWILTRVTVRLGSGYLTSVVVWAYKLSSLNRFTQLWVYLLSKSLSLKGKHCTCKNKRGVRE